MYTRNVSFEVIDKTRQWHATGCNAWSLTNIGNVNVTINKVLILEPGESYEGPNENPEIVDTTILDIEFDLKNDPLLYAPVGGTTPPVQVLLPGDPPPTRDTRLLISKSFITKK